MSEETPMPLLAATASPPDARSASVRKAELKTAFHPFPLAWLEATPTRSHCSLVSCSATMSAPGNSRTLVKAVLHALQLAESTAHSPLLGHHLGPSSDVGGRACLGDKYSSAASCLRALGRMRLPCASLARGLVRSLLSSHSLAVVSKLIIKL